MMNMLEEAIIYATVLYQGKIRKLSNAPYILHPMEVAQILSTLTSDIEVITAGMLHDIVEDTDGTQEEVEKRFGKRVAALVASEAETASPGENPAETWVRRKEETLLRLKNSDDAGVQMLWLADKLANIRSLAASYSEQGEGVWAQFHQSDPAMHCWYYRTVAETLELTFNRTGAFKELIKHINFIWPGTFDSDKARYKKYREVSVDGCEVIGKGAKGEVYRYDDELIIKVYNRKNTYHDVEQEIALSRKAFIMGIPTAISFGIVSVGTQYGAMYELVDSDTISRCIARSPGQVDYYARIMGELAREIHAIPASEDDGFPPVVNRLRGYIEGGIGREDEAIAQRCRALLDNFPDPHTMIHGDFHTGNVFLQKGEPLLIDMDRLSTGHPIAEIGDIYYTYVVRGEEDPSIVEKYMGFSYDTARRFYDVFMRTYLETEDEDRIREVTEKASLLCYSRMIRNMRKIGSVSAEDEVKIRQCVEKLAKLSEKLDTLAF